MTKARVGLWETPAYGSEVASMTLVLVAEDDPVTRELIAYKLGVEGYDVVGAGDGESALAAARERAPDIAILDAQMPGISGFEACRILRADPAIPQMPVIMLSGGVHQADVSAGFAAGADDYLTKPFSPRELVSRIQTVLGRA